MRKLLIAAVPVYLVSSFGCAQTGEAGPVPPLAVSASSTTAAGPVVITATPASLGDQVTWSLTGPGSLSGTAGQKTVYRPPVPVDPSKTATITATLGSQTQSVTLTLAPAPMPPGVIAGLGAQVTVTYDVQDIPHIFCATTADCLAAQGYLQARDRLFQMDFYRRVARGTVSTLLGPLGVSQDKQILTLLTTRDGKRIESQLVAAINADSDPTVKTLLAAYLGGINAYLKTVTKLPGEYSQLPVAVTPASIPAWTMEDVLALGRLQQFQLSETLSKELGYGLFAQVFVSAGVDPARFSAYVRAQQPLQGFTLSATDNPPAPLGRPPADSKPLSGFDFKRWTPGLAKVRADMAELQPIFGSMALGAGSNNWVVDKAHSATGLAMVANDPHLHLEYPPIFHMIAMTSADGALDLTGVAFPGIPGAQIGRGKHVGWGATVVGYDVTDIYLETLTGCGNAPPLVCTSVSFNGANVPLIPVQNKIDTGSGTPQTFYVLVVPHHGPIIHYDPTTQSAISVRWTGHEVTQDLKAFLGLNTATAVGSPGDAPSTGTAFGALSGYAVGAQNFVLADDQGNIGYDPHAIVPKRPWAGSQPGAQPLVPWLPLPGDGSAEWGSQNAADNCAGTGANKPKAACWIPDAQLPQGKNPTKGYYATANSDPIGYTAVGSIIFPNPSGDPGAFYLSFDWDDPTDVRYSRIAQLLKDKTTSGAAKMSVADMQSVQSDRAMLVAALFEPLYPASTQATYTAARALLTQWKADHYDCPTGLTTSDPKSAPDPDVTRNRDSAACLLFHAFYRTLFANVFNDEFAYVSLQTGQSLSPEDHLSLRSMLYMLSLDPAAPSTPARTSFCSDIDNRGRITTKTCQQQVITALVSAYAQLAGLLGTDTTKWIWGRAHTLTTVSPAAPLVSGAFAAGPYARPGGFVTVDVGNPDSSQSSPIGFNYSHGSNVRFVAQMGTDSASNVTKMQLPGPMRDGPYKLFADRPDLIGAYVNNQYFDFLTGHQVDSAAAATQTFTAQ
jgi:penicillin amidase